MSSCAIDDAHLVPEEEALWYRRNAMHRYSSDFGDINNATNLLPLRTDIHRCFDNRWFIIVPKSETGVAVPHSFRYVTQILSEEASDSELWPASHGVLVQNLHSGCGPYLFARFAWAVLLRVKRFVTSGLPIRVVRIHAVGKTSQLDRKVETLSDIELMSLYGGGGSKSATPMTPKRKQTSSAADEDDDFMESSYGSDIGMDGSSDRFWNLVDDWEQRGKRRKFLASSETTVEGINQARDETISGTALAYE